LSGAAGVKEQGVARQLLIPLLAALLAACGGGDAKQGGGARQVPLVKAEAATVMEFADRIEAVGTARANEQVTLAAPITERIVRLNFDDGAFVTRGQVVAVLRQAEQSAQLSEANARAREAQQQLQRVGALKDRGFATRSNYDTQVAIAAQARAQASRCRRRLAIA
jgi:membrane fusion protein (multidrug efflux system)